ncbi:hypothetical protein BDW67DRAFT_166851 [Aspergillus spinulosporus]
MISFLKRADLKPRLTQAIYTHAVQLLIDIDCILYICSLSGGTFSLASAYSSRIAKQVIRPSCFSSFRLISTTSHQPSVGYRGCTCHPQYAPQSALFPYLSHIRNHPSIHVSCTLPYCKPAAALVGSFSCRIGGVHRVQLMASLIIEQGH